ncbi:hypothetical protein QBC43DRAFT_311433 [Cladorrhinum sp. PSN259]|nr:hypothetical protein QBC43DRAFT_311433 [Cladorrhinum sp. PSN259]
MPRQATFSVVPEVLAPQTGAAPQRPMTSKQAQKLYREKTRQPKMTKQEMRRWELAEQERIRKELEKEKQLNRARFLREKKKEKEKEKMQTKKKSGQPVAPPRPSQPMITMFTRKKVAEQKKEILSPPREPELEKMEEEESAVDHETEDHNLRREELVLRQDEGLPISGTRVVSAKKASQPADQQVDERSGILESVLQVSVDQQASKDSGFSESLPQPIPGRGVDSQEIEDDESLTPLQRIALARRRALEAERQEQERAELTKAALPDPAPEDNIGHHMSEVAASPEQSMKASKARSPMSEEEASLPPLQRIALMRRLGRHIEPQAGQQQLQGRQEPGLERPVDHQLSEVPASPEQPVTKRRVDSQVIRDEASTAPLQQPPSLRERKQQDSQQNGQQVGQQARELVGSSCSSFQASGTARPTESRALGISGLKDSTSRLGAELNAEKKMEKEPLKEDKGCWNQNKKISSHIHHPVSRLPESDKENKRPIPSTQAFNLEAEEIDWDCIMTGVEKTGNNILRPKPPTPRRPTQVTPRPVQAPPKRPLEPTRSSASRPPVNIRPPPNTRPPVDQKRVSNGVQKPKYLPPHLRAQPSRPPAPTPEPKAQRQTRPSPEQAPLTSTQLFLLSNFDQVFPSFSQEARELELPVTKAPKPPTFKRPPAPAFLKPALPSKVMKPPPQNARYAPSKAASAPVPNKPMKAAPSIDIPFLSTQDLVMSTQDLQEIKVPAGTPLRSGPPVFLKPKSETPSLSQTGRSVAPGRQFLPKRR